jgi:hypothetical protein
MLGTIINYHPLLYCKDIQNKTSQVLLCCLHQEIPQHSEENVYDT